MSDKWLQPRYMTYFAYMEERDNKKRDNPAALSIQKYNTYIEQEKDKFCKF